MTKTIEADRSMKIWWHLTRPHTLTASFVPVFLGTTIAATYHNVTINLSLFLAMLAASMLIQAATNMFNEYYDYKRGLDNEHSVGIGGTIVRHGIAPKTIMKIALMFYLLAALLGLYICSQTSWWLAAIGLIGMLIGFFYTGGPLPIAYTPFGELVSGIVMGMGIVLIAFYLQTETITWQAISLSVPSMILVGAIMLSNNIRDIEGDTAGGRKTLAILVGRKNAIYILSLLFIISYLWILGLVIVEDITYWALLIFISLPFPLKAIDIFRLKKTPPAVMPAMKLTSQTNTLFGFLLAIGLFINLLLFS